MGQVNTCFRKCIFSVSMLYSRLSINWGDFYWSCFAHLNMFVQFHYLPILFHHFRIDTMRGNSGFLRLAVISCLLVCSVSGGKFHITIMWQLWKFFRQMNYNRSKSFLIQFWFISEVVGFMLSDCFKRIIFYFENVTKIKCGMDWIDKNVGPKISIGHCTVTTKHKRKKIVTFRIV